ncbi:MAG: Wzz/FepE/Etk N-terminal domain-containing protein, partial [Candidatus Acidiferrales bacterium]
MEDIVIRSRNPRPPLVQVADWMAVAIRHRRLMTLTFLGVLAGAVLAIFLLPPRYESNTKILVKRDRVDPLVTPDPTVAQQQLPPPVTEDDLNSEVELIKSQDLLENVVKSCSLEKGSGHAWLSWLHFPRSADEQSRLALDDAVRNL